MFDDNSDAYNASHLRSVYQTKNVFVTSHNLNPDTMARRILEWFVSTSYQILVLLDSDLVVAPRWLEALHKGLSHSKGLFSLYRSVVDWHKTKACGTFLCQKTSLGNAGTVWRRDIALKMLSDMPRRNYWIDWHKSGFDTDWSRWCNENNIPLEAVKQSAVLHVGLFGSWSGASRKEKAFGFPMAFLSEDIRLRAEEFMSGKVPTNHKLHLAAAAQVDMLWATKYVVVMPSVKRNNDTYLKKTLTSLEYAKPQNVEVILVNGNQPPEEHDFLNGWCSLHAKYTCVKVLPSTFRCSNGTLRQKLRSWRLQQAEHAAFAMQQFLITDAEYMIWLEDDVVVAKDLFSSLPEKDVVCLRSDGYCGAVAYMFKRWFVSKLVSAIETQKFSKPLDWIIDSIFWSEFPKMKKPRVPKVHHIGTVSTSGQLRPQTKTEHRLFTSKGSVGSFESDARSAKSPFKSNIVAGYHANRKAVDITYASLVLQRNVFHVKVVSNFE